MSPAAPTVTCRHLSVPKHDGESVSEDAAAVRTDAWPLRAAVADGATESAFAARWADVLVQGMVDHESTAKALAAALPDWQARWQKAVEAKLSSAPWYLQAKAADGAFATLLGLELSREGRWRAVTVGDGGLFQLRDNAVHEVWPTADPDAFTNRPALLPSRATRPVPAPQTTTGTWAPDDAFLLVTDAVAAWLLRTDPLQAREWTADRFREAVHAARADGTLRTDDATLLILEIEETTDGRAP
jgi:hypothetical protein